MIEVLDFSPHHPNTENVQNTLYYFKGEKEFLRIRDKLMEQGFSFCGGTMSYSFVKKYNPRSHYFFTKWNSITGKKEMTITCKSYLKTYPQFKGININNWVKSI